MNRLFRFFPLLVLSAALVAPTPAAEPVTLCLLNQAQVDSQGIFLDQLFANLGPSVLPHARLADAPAFGQSILWSRAQIQAWMQTNAPRLTIGGWIGSDRIRIVRRSRVLGEAEVKELAQATLQRTAVRAQGELELRLTPRWTPVSIPDEPLEMKTLELPAGGITRNFVFRAELRTPKETVGTWPLACQARIWHEIWVAAGPLKRGQLLSPNDLIRERRDILGLRDLLETLPPEGAGLEMAENLNPGTPLSQRSLRARPLVRRGDVVEAVVEDGTLTITLKVEVLEEGAFGQSIRVRNPQTKREFRGKVQNEQTIVVSI